MGVFFFTKQTLGDAVKKCKIAIQQEIFYLLLQGQGSDDVIITGTKICNTKLKQFTRFTLKKKEKKRSDLMINTTS